MMSQGLDDPESTPVGDKVCILRHQEAPLGPPSLLSSGYLKLELKRPRREAIYVHLVPKLRMCHAILPTPHGFLAYHLIM